MRRWRARHSAVRWLVLAIAFVAVFRLLLYVMRPGLVGDLEILYHAAVHFLKSEDPHPIAHFDIVMGSGLAHALWWNRGTRELLAVFPGAYLIALRNSPIPMLNLVLQSPGGLGLLPALRSSSPE